MIKKIINYLMLLSVGMLIFSCSNDKIAGNKVDPNPKKGVILRASKGKIAPQGVDGQNRIAYTPNMTGTGVTKTGTIDLTWEEGDIIRLYEADAEGNPVAGGFAVADFVLKKGSGNGGNNNANAEFSFDGDPTAVFVDEKKYVAIAISGSNPMAKEDPSTEEIEYPLYPVPSNFTGNAQDATSVLSQCILNSVNTITWNARNNSFSYSDITPAPPQSEGSNTGVLRFETNFVIVYAELQKPSNYNTTGTTTVDNATIVVTISTELPTPEQRATTLSYTLNAATGSAIWKKTGVGDSTTIPIFFALDAIGDYVYLDFDVVDAYSRHYQAIRDTYVGDLVSANLAPNTYIGRRINAESWTNGEGYYMYDLQSSAANAAPFTKARGVITLLDGMTEAEATADGILPAYKSGTNFVTSNLTYWNGNIRTAISNRGVDNPLVVVYPYLKAPTGTGSTSNGFSGIKQGLGKIIAPQLTAVPMYFCYGVTSLESAEFPAAETIGNFAFQEATNLQNILLTTLDEDGAVTSNLTTIGQSAFIKTKNLFAQEGDTLTLPAVTSLGASAFEDSGIQNVVMNGITSITSASVFDSCKNLQSIEFQNLTNMSGPYTFQGCTALTKVTLPALKTISGASNFQGCTALTQITLPALTTISGASTFQDCSSLGTVNFPELQTMNVAKTFWNCAALESVNLPRLYQLGQQSFGLSNANQTPALTITLGTEVATRPGDTPFYNQAFFAGYNLFDHRFIMDDILPTTGGYNLNPDAGPITLILSSGFAKWQNVAQTNPPSTTSGFKVTATRTYNDPSILDGTGYYWWTSGNNTNSTATNTRSFGKFKRITIVPLPGDVLQGQGSDEDGENGIVMKPGTW